MLVLCNGVLNVLSMDDLSVLALSGSSKLKGVTTCCVNENPYHEDPFTVQVEKHLREYRCDRSFSILTKHYSCRQMCLCKKKQLAVVSLSEEKLVVERTCDLGDNVTEVCMDGHFVCAATSSHYVICNVPTGQQQDLFPIEGIPMIARVAKVIMQTMSDELLYLCSCLGYRSSPDKKNLSAVVFSQEEFLLSAPGGLGMFVTAEGVSQRPPIQWTKPVLKFVHCHPYVIAMTRDTVNIFR